MMAGRPRDFAWVSVGFGVQLSAQFGRAILLARLLTPHDLGLYFVLRSVAGVVAIVVPLGLGLIGLRLVAAARADAVAARTAVRTTLRLTTAGSLVAVPAAWLCVRGAGFGAVDATLVAVMIVALAWTGVLADLTRGLGETRQSVGIEKIAGSLVDVAGLTVILLLARQSTLTVTLGIVAGAAMFPVAGLSIALMRALSDHGAAPFASSEGQATAVTSGALLSESWPVAANALFWRALAEVDLWMVAWLTGPEETALVRLGHPAGCAAGTAEDDGHLSLVRTDRDAVCRRAPTRTRAPPQALGPSGLRGSGRGIRRGSANWTGRPRVCFRRRLRPGHAAFHRGRHRTIGERRGGLCGRPCS